MSSNNINESAMLKHVASCFHAWGIHYVHKQTFKEAQNNSPKACHTFIHLLFDLSILIMTDYHYLISQLAIQIDLSTTQQYLFLQEFILSFLSQIQCPFLSSQNQKSALDFSSSRNLLLIVGWLMAKTNFFIKIRDKLIIKKYGQIFQHPHLGKKLGKTNLINKQIDLADDNQTIQGKYIILRQLNKKIENFEHKKQKLIKNCEKKLQQYNKKTKSSLKMDEILGKRALDEKERNQIEQKVAQLKALIEERINKMKNQQFFWIWLDIEVKRQVKQLRQTWQEFEELDGNDDYHNIIINQCYLKNYLHEFKSISSAVQALNTEFQDLQPFLEYSKKPGERQNIEKQINNDIKNVFETISEEEGQMGNPSFLAIEVNKYIEDHGWKKKKEKAKKRVMARGSRDKVKNELKIEINEFIHNLEQIKFL